MSYWERGSFLNQCGDCSFLQGFFLKRPPGPADPLVALALPKGIKRSSGPNAESSVRYLPSCFVLRSHCIL